MLYLLCHQGPLGTVCYPADSDHVCLWQGYHLSQDTAKYIRPWHTGPTSGFMVCGVTSYISQSDLVFLQDKVNSALYIAQVVNPVLLPFLRCANWKRMGHDEAKTYSFSRACHNHCRIATTGARCLGQSIAGWYSAPLRPFACENTRLRCRQRGVTLSIDMTVWAPLTVTCFVWSEFVIVCYYNDRLSLSLINFQNT